MDSWHLDLEPLLPHFSANFSTTWQPKPFPRECTVVDLGGSTLRVAKTNYSTLTHTHIEQAPAPARQAPLDWLAQTLDDLQVPSFNLCWAFPLKDGCLQAMGKGWKLDPELVGKDLAHELNSRLKTTRVLGVVHDAVASLMAQHVLDASCRVAVTWGTGFNVALYMGDQLINCEMGFAGTPPFGSYLPMKWYDVKLEYEGPNMPLERMVGGAYLGKLYTLATGTPTETDQLWSLVSCDTTAAFIVTRACQLVARAIWAAAKLAGGSPKPTVAYTGGVIFEPTVQALLLQELDRICIAEGSHYEISLVAQRHGPELGASIV